MKTIRIINGAGYGGEGESSDDYEIKGLDEIQNASKSITIKDRKNASNNINEKWLKPYEGNPKKYIAALFEVAFPNIKKRIYVMVGSGSIKVFETHKDEKIASLFSNISSYHGKGDMPIVTIALGHTHMYIQAGGKVLPRSLFNNRLQSEKKSKDTYIDRMENDSFSWEQLQDLEYRLETMIQSKQSKDMSSANYKTLEGQELQTDVVAKKPANGSKTQTNRKRCPNGTRRNSKGECEPKPVK
jgi:hypothetical protein